MTLLQVRPPVVAAERVELARIVDRLDAAADALHAQLDALSREVDRRE